MESTDPTPAEVVDVDATTTGTGTTTNPSAPTPVPVITNNNNTLHDTSESSHMPLLEQWGTMGGGIGEDNAFLVQDTTPLPNRFTPQAYTASTASVFLSEQASQHYHPAAGAVAEGGGGREEKEDEDTQDQRPPSYLGGGSITRFAAEAAHAVGAVRTTNANHDPSTHEYSGTTPNTTSSTSYVSPFAKPVPPPVLSFAERSQQAYINSGSRPIPVPVVPPVANVIAQGTVVGMRPPQPSSQIPPPQAPQTSSPVRMMYGVNPIPSVTGGGVGGHPHNMSYAPHPTSSVPSSVPSTSHPYPSSTPVMQHQPPQPQPVVVVPAAGSYAARSAAAAAQTPPNHIYGATQQPYGNSVMSQQQQQQPPHQQQPQQPMMGNTVPTPSMHRTGMPNATTNNTTAYHSVALGTESTQFQQKILTDSIRKVQEHAYYMKQAMEQKNLAVTLDRAAHMVGELGGPPHGHPTTSTNTSTGHSHNNANSGAPTNTGVSAKLTPKNYYDLYMRALEDMPLLEEYLYNLAMTGSSMSQQPPIPPTPGMIHIVADASQLAPPTATTITASPKYTMKQLYDCVQYCPRVVSRLYLQVAAGSALIRSGECSAKYVMADLQDAVRCEQNPVRGLFLRYFLITALRDKLPDTPPSSPPPPASSTVTDAVMTNNRIDENGDETTNDMNDDRPTTATTQTTADKETKVDDDYLDDSNVDMTEEGTVKDSYEFILSNFMEMNKLWVRIQHLPGEGKDKEARKRRERERNDLRILVGTNLVRLSQLECVTSKIYGEEILPYILEHIVTTGDPLSQAYLMDCLVQVFPDEYHIETLPILLNVCPRLKDKVNIRTILQGLMDRLAKYLADEELLDESDTNQVKISLAKDSFGLFEECVQKVYNARGPKLTSKEVIRLQTALLHYSIKCFPGHVEQVGRCIDSCVTALQQANASYDTNPDNRTTTTNTNSNNNSSSTGNSNSAIGAPSLDDASVAELEKLLSIPLDSLALKVLEFDTYSQLISFLPWQNRREVAISMLKAVENSGSTPKHIKDIEQLFHVIEPLVRDETYPQMPQQTAYIGMMQQSAAHMDPNRLSKVKEENCHVAKLLHTLNNSDVDIMYSILLLAKRHLTHELSGPDRTVHTLTALVFAAFRLASRVFSIERNPTVDPSESGINSNADAETSAAVETTSGNPEVNQKERNEVTTTKVAKSVSARTILVLVQETIDLIAKHDPEKGLKLYVEASAYADRNATTKPLDNDGTDMAAVSYELLRLAMTLYEDRITDVKCQCRCITSFSGTILALKSVSKENYESLITRTAQFSAKIALKPEQCQLVALCAHLFYPADNGGQSKYSNPQRALECLQRSLKLADACTSANPVCVTLFVDLLEHYLYFFEKKNPLITHAYITGLIALINEHLNSTNAIGNDKEAKAHFVEVIRYIKKKKMDTSDVSEMFSQIQIG